MFDGNGNWTSDFSAQADRDNGIKILASRFDNIFIADIKESFENCLTKDGQIAPIENFNMGGQRITNLNAGVNDNDAVNMSQLDTKANSSDVVNLTGTQTIAGPKTFIDGINIKNNFVSSIILEIPGVQWASLNLQYNGIGPYLTTGDFQNFLPLFLGPSDNVNSAVTTLAIGTNYVKLGNGLIIQWGSITGSGNYNFYIPFTTESSISLIGADGTGVNDNNAIIGLNTTGFTAVIYGRGGAYWMAIGK